MSRVSAYMAATIGLLVITVLSVSCGETFISPSRWLNVLVVGDSQSLIFKIIWELRMPRVIGAGIVGACLACAGVAFQGLFRNPLAEPYVIGASSGAALGVSVAVALGWQSSSTQLLGINAAMAMCGALAVALLVLLIGSLGRVTSTVNLLLVGIAISSLINAIVSAVMIFNDQRAVAVLAWIMGSLANCHWGTVAVTAAIAIPVLVWTMLLARPLDAFSLGDTSASSIGLHISRFRIGVVIAASLATAAAVSAAGIVGFVGLVAPHIARRLGGQKHANSIPLSICIGASVMMLADLVSRTVIAPAEMPVGIVTAIVGCPFFLWLLLTNNRNLAQINA
jgi:iron complex transport system permease protein